MAGNGWKWLKWLDMTGKGCTNLKIVVQDWIFQEMAGQGRKGWECLKMSRNVWNWLELANTYLKQMDLAVSGRKKCITWLDIAKMAESGWK